MELREANKLIDDYKHDLHKLKKRMKESSDDEFKVQKRTSISGVTSWARALSKIGRKNDKGISVGFFKELKLKRGTLMIFSVSSTKFSAGYATDLYLSQREEVPREKVA